MRRPLPALIAAIALAAAPGCGGDEQAAEKEKPASDGPTATGSASAPGCKDVAAPAPREDGGAKEPKGGLDPNRTHTVMLATNCGRITIELDVTSSPETTASFASLARQGFFDNTVFHRIVPDFVIQGGDPTGSGSGGPGYSTVDKPPADTVYSKGVVAMAKTGQEAPGTAGSQFYVVTGDAVQLPPEYALLGKVTAGQDVADRIGRLGDPQSGEAGTPLQPVVIERARVRAK